MRRMLSVPRSISARSRPGVRKQKRYGATRCGLLSDALHPRRDGTNFRILLRALPDHKECRFYIFLTEQVEQFGRVHGVGTVVEGQGNAIRVL